jgi:hypothetical protein
MLRSGSYSTNSPARWDFRQQVRHRVVIYDVSVQVPQNSEPNLLYESITCFKLPVPAHAFEVDGIASAAVNEGSSLFRFRDLIDLFQTQ